MRNFNVGENIYVTGYDPGDLFKAIVVENIDDRHMKIRYEDGSTNVVEKDWGCYHSLSEYPKYLLNGGF